MKPNQARLAGLMLGLVACGLATPVSAQDAARPQCPAGYWRYETVCIDGVTGDVVSASVANGLRTEAEAGCAPGYWRFSEVCIGLADGDVAMTQERTRAASR